MWMEVHTYSVKAKSQAGNIWVEDIMAAARDHKNLRILQENLAGESTAAVTSCLSMRIRPKSYRISPLKESATLLYGSRKGAVGA